jgi:hypothetical protein
MRVLYPFHPLYGESLDRVSPYRKGGVDGWRVAVPDGGNVVLPAWMFDPVIERKRKVRAKDGDGFFAVCGVAIGLANGAGRNAHG